MFPKVWAQVRGLKRTLAWPLAELGEGHLGICDIRPVGLKLNC